MDALMTTLCTSAAAIQQARKKYRFTTKSYRTAAQVLSLTPSCCATCAATSIFVHLDCSIVVKDHVLQEPRVGPVLCERGQGGVEGGPILVHYVAPRRTHVSAVGNNVRWWVREVTKAKSVKAADGDVEGTVICSTLTRCV